MTNKEKHIPQGYKDSPLGIIPKEWEVKRLGDICDYVDYRGKSPNKSSKGIFLVTAKNIREGYIDYEVSQEFIPIDEFEDTMRRGKAQIGDVLITTEAPLGHVAQIDNSNIALAQRVIKYRAKNGLLNTYLKHFLMSEKFQTLLKANATGSTALGIKGSRLHQLPIILPCVDEQKQILLILNLWDTTIEKQLELIEKLKLRKRALMQQLLTGKKRLPGFSGKWRKIKAGELFTSSSIKGNPDEVLLSATQEYGVIPRDQLEGRVTMPKGNLGSFKLVEEGDFVISLRSFQGGIEYSKYRGIVSPAYNVLKPIIEIDKAFYQFYFKSSDFIGHLAVAVIGIRDGKQISYDDFCFVKIPYPNIDEQKAISCILLQADKEIELANEKLARLQSQKRGLMQQLLTGKKRIMK